MADPSEPNNAGSSSWRRRIITSDSVDLLNHFNQQTFTTVRKVTPLSSSEKFLFHRDQMDLGRVSLVHVRCTPVQLEVLPSTHMIVVISENGQSLYTAKGLEVASSHGDAAIVPNYGESVYRSSSDSRFAVQIPYDELAAHFRKGHDSSFRSRLNKPLQFDLASSQAINFRRIVSFIWGQSAPDSPLLRGAFDEVLLQGLVAMLAPALADKETGRGADLGMNHVQRACEILRAKVSEPVRIADIAGALGVSPRHLQSEFRRRLNTTPLQFLRECRLEHANRRLSNPRPGETTASIAFNCGFAHPGEFAQEYRRRFGESPSETLRRRRWREPAF